MKQRGNLGPAEMRLANERLVLESLRELRPLSASAVAHATGLSRPTANSALASLESAGLISMHGIRTGNAGRAPRLWAPRYEAGWVISIDVGVDWIRLALADLSETVADRRQQQHFGDLLEQIIGMVTEVIGESRLRPEDVLAIVIGTPGSYDPSVDRLRLAPNLPTWERSVVMDQLTAALGNVVQLENDIDLAAIGEQSAGAGRGIPNFVYLSVGHGVGMGLVLGGQLHRGTHGTAGEIAFLPIGDVDQMPTARARQRGMLEAATASDDLLAYARKAGVRVRSVERLFELARAGDSTASAVVDREAHYLARGLAAVVALVDPGLVVLGGGVGRGGGDLLLPPLAEYLQQLLPLQLPELALSTTGGDATLIGGIALATELAWSRAIERHIRERLCPL